MKLKALSCCILAQTQPINIKAMKKITIIF